MNARHGWSPALRLLRRPPPPSTSSSRSFGDAKRLNDVEPQDRSYKWRRPYSASMGAKFPLHIRHLMRSMPHALAVITSRPGPKQYPDIEKPPAAAAAGRPPPKVAGLLVSSFNTVALTPHVYVSFNVRLPSNTYTGMQRYHGFTASGVKDPVVADAFVKRRHPSGDETEPDENRWQGLVTTDGKLKPGMGGTWWMHCRLVQEKCVEVGDHVIVVGEVLACGGYWRGEGTGLVYAEGAYRKVEPAVDGMEQHIKQGFRRPSSHLLFGSKDISQTASSDT